MTSFTAAMWLALQASAWASSDDLERRLQRAESPPEAAPHTPIGESVVVPQDAHWDAAVAWSGDVWVDGAVTGPVVAVGGDVHIAPSANVVGDVVSLGGDVMVAPGASVHGDRLGVDAPELHPRSRRSLVHRLAAALVMVSSLVLTAHAWPTRGRNIADTLARGATWYAVGGAIAMGAGAVLATGLALTIVGLPVAVVVGAVLAITALSGAAGVARVMGERVPGPMPPPWKAALIGGTLLVAVAQVPWLGPLVASAVVCAGLGAAITSRLGTRAARDI